MPTLRSTFIVVLCIVTLLAKTANSTGSPSNLNLQGIQSVAGASTESVAKSGSGSVDQSGRALLGGGQSALSLPFLTVLEASPKWSFVFPFLGLIAAVAATQLLRRRRIAQLRASSLAGQ